MGVKNEGPIIPRSIPWWGLESMDPKALLNNSRGGEVLPTILSWMPLTASEDLVCVPTAW